MNIKTISITTVSGTSLLMAAVAVTAGDQYQVRGELETGARCSGFEEKTFRRSHPAPGGMKWIATDQPYDVEEGQARTAIEQNGEVLSVYSFCRTKGGQSALVKYRWSGTASR